MADEISADELSRLLKGEGGRPVIVIDVRLGQIGAIPGAHHVPVTDLEDREWHWDPQADLVVYCQFGKGGSEYAAEVLEEQGFAHVHKLRGGMDAWTAFEAKNPQERS